MSSALRAAFQPREVFPSHNVVLANFPGYHRAALFALRQLAFQIDLIVELRDSRAPISCINPLFDQVLGGKKKIVVYTKRDLSKLSHSVIEKWDPRQEFLRIESSKRTDIKRVYDAIVHKFPKHDIAPPLGYRVLITGMPNVGKSTVINSLRQYGIRDRGRKRVARTGNTPGVTRSISEAITVSDSPKIFIHDTPGVFIPQARNPETMMNMCLINAVNYRNVVDPVVLADYLLFMINKNYAAEARYPGPQTNEITAVLKSLATTRSYNPEMVAAQWLQRYQNGAGPKLVLDDTSPEHYRKVIEDGERITADLGGFTPDRGMRKRFMM